MEGRTDFLIFCGGTFCNAIASKSIGGASWGKKMYVCIVVLRSLAYEHGRASRILDFCGGMRKIGPESVPILEEIVL